MHSLRALIRDYRALALLLAGIALFARALVPQGYMASGERTMTVQLCFDGIEHRTMTVAVPVEGEQSQQKADHCPYAALGMSGLAAADPGLLAIALLFILALGFAPVASLPADRSARLRPPLRGPPLTA